VPRTAITPQGVTSAGRAPAYEPANVDGNSIRPVPGRLVHVKNAGTAAVTVTIPTPGTVDGLAVADRTISVAAGADQLIALGKGEPYRQPGNVAHLNYSAVTSVTVAVFDVP
jgi:hypothetical protein